MGPINWEGIKKDIRKGVKEGYIAMKEGVLVASKKAEEFTDEGKKQYRILELKTRIHKTMHDLGGRVYDLMGSSGRIKSPAGDKGVKEMVAQIQGYEVQIAALEQKGAKSGGVSARKSKK